MPISWYAPRNRRKKRAGGSPLDPAAERIFEMRSGNKANKKQRTAVKSRTAALWVGYRQFEQLRGDRCEA